MSGTQRGGSKLVDLAQLYADHGYTVDAEYVTRLAARETVSGCIYVHQESVPRVLELAEEAMRKGKCPAAAHHSAPPPHVPTVGEDTGVPTLAKRKLGHGEREAGEAAGGPRTRARAEEEPRARRRTRHSA